MRLFYLPNFNALYSVCTMHRQLKSLLKEISYLTYFKAFIIKVF